MKSRCRRRDAPEARRRSDRPAADVLGRTAWHTRAPRKRL